MNSIASALREEETGLRIVPVLDLLFLLLLVGLTLLIGGKDRALSLELPRADHAEIRDAEQAIVLEIDRDGNLALQRKTVQSDELPARLKALATKELPVLVVRGDRAASLGLVIRILDAARAVGIPEISFVVEPERGEGNSTPLPP